MIYKHKNCIECDKPRMKKPHPITHYLRCEEHHKRHLEYTRKSKEKCSKEKAIYKAIEQAEINSNIIIHNESNRIDYIIKVVAIEK